MDVVDPHLAAFDAGEAVAELDTFFADRLHLGAQERDTGFEGLDEVVVVVRLAVVCDDFRAASRSVFAMSQRPTVGGRTILR